MTTSNEQVFHAYLQAYNSEDWDRLGALVSADYRHHNNDSEMTLEEFLQGARWYRTAMPDLEVRLEDLVAAQDRIVARFTLHATHSTSVFGEAPSGSALVLHGMTMYRFAAGRIAEDWEVMDEADLRRQVGVLDGG